MIKRPTTERLKEYRRSPIAFIEDMVILEDNKPIKLEDWQRKVLTEAFERDEKGNLKYNIILISVPKKNGKTTLLSAIILWGLFAHMPNAEVFCLSGDREQAGISFDKVKKMIMRNPLLMESCRITRNEIYVPDTDSFFRVLSSDAPTNHGNLASICAFDELWQFEGNKDKEGRELWYAMTHTPTRESVTIITTYAGSDQSSLLYELYQTGLKKEDPKLYMFWSHENLSHWVSEEYLEQQRKRLPPHIFQRLHENRWTQGESSFITKAELETCKDYLLKPQLGGKDNTSYFLAVDLGLVRDRTVLTICHKDLKDNLVYLDYIKVYQGSKKNPVLISDVERDIIWAHKNFNLRKVILDPWQLKNSSQNLSRMGIRIEEFNFTSSSVQKLSQNLYYLCHNSLIRIFPHKQLEEELLSLNVVEKSYGWKVDHKSGRYSDCSISLGMSALYAVESGSSSTGIYFGNWEKPRYI